MVPIWVSTTNKITEKARDGTERREKGKMRNGKEKGKTERESEGAI